MFANFCCEGPNVPLSADGKHITNSFECFYMHEKINNNLYP